jgi:hypothetical protein
MDSDILGMVISVEKEIQACLEAERVKASEWLEGIKKSYGEEFAQEEARIREDLLKSAAEAEDEATAKAGVIIKDAEEKAARLASLSDEALTGIIMQRITGGLPE